MTDSDKTQDAARAGRHAFRRSRTIAALLFGVVIPVFILGEAFYGLFEMQRTVIDQLKAPPRGLVLEKREGATSMDYALYAMTYAEASNRQVVVNKQVLKTSVMEVGLAVISMGIMVILLGFETGGATVSASAAAPDAKAPTALGGLNLNLQTASTGVVVFVAGALMASAGGLMKNDYRTVGTPVFGGGPAQNDAVWLNYYNDCKQSDPKDYKACFTEQFENIHTELPR